MRLSLRAMVMAGAILWGGAILLVGLINFFDPNYGVNFLQMTRSSLSVVSFNPRVRECSNRHH